LGTLTSTGLGFIILWESVARMVKLTLSEKIDERINIESIEEWLNRLLMGAGVEVSVGKLDNKWLCVETDNPSLFLSTLNLQVYYPLEPVEKPVLRTCWIEKIDDKTVTCSYPSIDGSTQQSRYSLDDWIAYLGGSRTSLGYRKILESIGIDVSYPINVTLDRPSILFRKLVENLVVKGLDAVFIRGLTPLECENLIHKEGLGKFIADFTYLTLTTQILYLKLGVKTRRIIEYILTASSKLGKPLNYEISEWNILKPFASFLETCTWANLI